MQLTRLQVAALEPLEQVDDHGSVNVIQGQITDVFIYMVLQPTTDVSRDTLAPGCLVGLDPLLGCIGECLATGYYCPGL